MHIGLRAYLLLATLFLSAVLSLLLSSSLLSPTERSSTVTAPATVVFLDDFEDGVLDGWVTDSTWSIEDEDGNLLLHSQVPAGDSALANVQDRTYRDFTVQFQVKLLERDASIFFRQYSDGVNYGFYDVTLGPDAIGLAKERDGNWQALAGATPDVKYGQWYTLAVTGEDQTITITLDDRPVLSYTDTTDPILAGGIGFENRGHLHLDDVTIGVNIPASDAISWSSTAAMSAGGVWAISIAPADPDIVYLATLKNNLYRSGNSGQTWTLKGESLGAHVFAPIAVHPNNPDIIYVSNGVVHRSDDGGDTFVSQGIGSGESVGVQAIAIYGADPDIVYAGDDTGTAYKTVNGGRDWNAVGVLGENLDVRTLLIHPSDPDKLFAAVAGTGIYTSTNGGTSWIQVLAISPSDQSLVMHPVKPDVLYVTDGTDIYRTANAGAKWTPLTSFPPEPGHLTIAAADPAVLYVSTPSGVYRSYDGGGRWSPTAYDVDMFGPTPALAVSPIDANVIYAGVEDGVVLSIDGGASWSASNNGLVDLDAWQLAVSPADSETLYAGTACMRGLFQTADAGSIWDWVPEHFHYVMDIAVVPSQPKVLYLTDRDGLFQSLDGGHDWNHVADTGSDHLHGLAVDPVNPGVAYVGSVGGTDEFSAVYSTIYKTTNGGASWTEINNGFPLTAASVHTIAIDPTNTNTVYVGTYREGLFHTQGSGIGIYKSADGGGSWTPINQGLTTRNVAALTVDPFNPQTVYAGTDQGLFVTANSGGKWTLVDGAPKDLINAIVPDSKTQGTLYITTQGAGIFRTTNGGTSWFSLNQGLPFPLLPVGDLIVDPSSGILYAAVRGGGVYRGVHQPTWEIYLPVVNKNN